MILNGLEMSKVIFLDAEIKNTLTEKRYTKLNRLKKLKVTILKLRRLQAFFFQSISIILITEFKISIYIKT